MASLFKNLLGNATNEKELGDEMRTLLEEMRKERDRYAGLVDAGGVAAQRLESIQTPLAKAGEAADTVLQRLAEIEQRLEGVTQLSSMYENLDARAEEMTRKHEAAAAQLTRLAEDSQNTLTIMESLAQKAAQAEALKAQIDIFMETDKPIQALRNEADTLRTQVEGSGEQMARLREQHDRLLDANKLALSKMEALDRRRDELGRSIQDKERRLAGVEQAVRGMDGVQTRADEMRRELHGLKTLADLVSQKTIALEAQRDSVDRALAQSEHLDRAMRQLAEHVQQQKTNEAALAALQEQVSSLRNLHESVLERSSEISAFQQDVDARTAQAREELAAVTDESRKTVERFDFERRGLESVTQRVADLRSSVTECETRFRPLTESSRTMNELLSQAQGLGTQLRSIASEAAALDGEIAKLAGLKQGLAEAIESASELHARARTIEDARPQLDAGLHDLATLASSHAAVREAWDQARNAREEYDAMRGTQAETRTWLAAVQQSLAEMRTQAAMLQEKASTLEFVEAQTRRIGESMSQIEAKREFTEDLHRRMSELASLSKRLDERGTQLNTRMEAAEQHFVALHAQAETAEKMTMTMAAVASEVAGAQAKSDAVKQTVEAIAARCESVEALAGKTQALKKEIEQRAKSLQASAQELERAATLREEASALAQELAATRTQLSSELGAAKTQTAAVGKLAGELEQRAAGLHAVQKRLDAFEQKLSAWDVADTNVSQALEEIAARQATVGALQAELDRMVTLTSETAGHVREIASAHGEMAQAREQLESVREQLQGLEETTNTLDERKRQLTRAEERLARSEGLLTDLRSNLESLHGQRALVEQAVEKTGSLQFLLKQADAAIDSLRDERNSSAKVKSAISLVERDDDDTDDKDDLGDKENVAKAA